MADTARDFPVLAEEGGDALDATRPVPVRHMAFGHGPRSCPGVALSRPEAVIALPAPFTRLPVLRPAVPAEETRGLPVLTQNDEASLPVPPHG